MIITDNFVLLAFPKTGTSYTTNVLRKIHARRGLYGRLWPDRWQKRNFPRPGYREHRVLNPAAPPKHKARMLRHGTFRDIPEADRHKKIVSIIRDPFSRYTSFYLFQTRMRDSLRPVADPELLQASYPNYPELSFSEYYDMLHRFDLKSGLGGITPPVELGSHTVSFINFYFRDPPAVFRKISKAYIEDRAWESDMANIHFLHQASLREEFANFLREMGYSEAECRLAAENQSRNVATRKKGENDPGHFYDEALREKVLERDALIFSIFPEFAPRW